ncbi:PEP-CTERM domain-containing protein [Rubrivivax sp. A210]|uniref:DUF1194 domain-containing protein n=1 Tax=Rubrivivax sp. A210 TaxID=2772301 RepID=UPI001917F141|nr:DUF1194 domain-containing protein [Rubrivivax sp. A210]CAD5374334.1 PEP-CTERM domain-containing protein [Rubrivivax sp. A210]
MFRKNLAAVALGALLATGGAHAITTSVALELALVIDVSGSVCSTAFDAFACPGLGTSEYQLQLDGYRAAFNDAGVRSAIESFAPSGGIAVGVYFFSQGVMRELGWQALATGAQSAAFGDAMGALARPRPTALTAISPSTGWEGVAGSGPILNTGTNVAGGIQAGAWGMEHNDFAGARRVIDVSGDGVQNSLLSGMGSCFENSAACNQVVDGVRASLAPDIVVNGLAIEGDLGVGGLTTWYGQYVQRGGFVVTAAGFDDFERAVVLKIGREIAGPEAAPVPVPESETMLMFFFGLLGIAAVVHRRAD